MTPEQCAFYSDRILRAVARGESMSDAQRNDLAGEIRSLDPPENISTVLAKLLSKTLSDDEAIAVFKANKLEGFDPAAFKASLAPAPNPAAALDAKLKALLQS
jgi:hypothetical protein